MRSRTMDDFHARALKTLRERHESQIRENARRIQEHIGYVLQRAENGHADTVGLYAEDIAASAQRIVARVAALGAIGDAVRTLETGDELAEDLGKWGIVK
jgi:hypothetical protein